MIWEIDKRKRNTNNVVTLYLKNNLQINKGDCVTGLCNAENKSFYIVDEIIEERKSAHSEFKYLKVKTSWTSKLNNIREYNTENTSSRFRTLLDLN